jgi:hypothetical protein
MRNLTVRGKKMAEHKKDPVAGKSDMASERQRQSSDGTPLGFDAPAKLDYWFNSQLMQMYAEVVSEPLPKDLLDLLDRLREKSKGTS